MGHDPELLRCPPLPRREGTAAVHIGHWEPHTERGILALRAAGVDVEVRGYNWFKARDRSLRQARFLPHEEYAATIAASRIGLCFLSRWNRNESTGRSFDIPAIGTFMLAERTGEHEFIYGDGVLAALFSTTAELVEKARHYLAHPDEREAVAAAGHARVRETGYSWTDHMRREWPLVERLLGDPTAAPSPADEAPFWPGFRLGVEPPEKPPRRAAREA
jgi:hypothetical protein